MALSNIDPKKENKGEVNENTTVDVEQVKHMLLPPTYDIEENAPNPEEILKNKIKGGGALPLLDTLNDYYFMVKKSDIEITQHPFIVYEKRAIGPYEVYAPKRWVVVETRSIPPLIVCSDQPIYKGKIEGYLKHLDSLGECISVPIENKSELLHLLKTSKLSNDPIIKDLLKDLEEAEQDEESIIGTIMGAKPSSFKIYQIDTFVPEIGEFVLKHWEDFKDELFKAYDPWIREVYRAYMTTIPMASYAPHAFIITPSGVGKSTLADSIGISWTEAKWPTIVGGYYDGKIRIGVIHGKDYLVQIESFESPDSEALYHLHNVLAIGESHRAVGGRDIGVVFTGPMTFTNNAYAVVDVPLIELVSKLSNPIALGSRFVPLFNTRVLPANRSLYFNKKAVKEAMEAVRALTRRKVRMIYFSKEVREWFEEEPEDWDEVRMRILSLEVKNENLRAYLHSFAKDGWRKVKALSFARAMSERLDDVWAGTVTPQIMINAAENYLGDLGSGYIRMIRAPLEDVDIELEEELRRLSLVLDREKFVDHFLDVLVDMVKNNLEAQSKNQARLDLGEVKRLVEAKAESEGKVWKLSNEKFAKKVNRLRTRSETRILVELVGLKIEEDKIVVRARDLVNLKRELDRLRT